MSDKQRSDNPELARLREDLKRAEQVQPRDENKIRELREKIANAEAKDQDQKDAGGGAA